MVSTSQQKAFARTLLRALAVVGASGLPAYVALAMTALESGWGTATNSDFALERNPWGLTASCLGFPVLPPSRTGAAVPLVEYPDYTDAAADLVAFLNPASGCNTLYGTAWAARSNASLFLSDLQAAGWAGAGAPPWAGDVEALLPQARSILQSVGVDPVTARVPSTGGGPVTGPAAPQPTPKRSAIGIAAGVLMGLGGAALVAVGLSR